MSTQKTLLVKRSQVQEKEKSRFPFINTSPNLFPVIHSTDKDSDVGVVYKADKKHSHVKGGRNKAILGRLNAKFSGNGNGNGSSKKGITPRRNHPDGPVLKVIPDNASGGLSKIPLLRSSLNKSQSMSSNSILRLPDVFLI